VKYKIVDRKTNKVLDDDAIPTPFMLADWRGRAGKAVKRNGCWYAINYPDFAVNSGETVFEVVIREDRTDDRELAGLFEMLERQAEKKKKKKK
jgi:predicted HAD superfamily phosphohydrolase